MNECQFMTVLFVFIPEKQEVDYLFVRLLWCLAVLLSQLPVGLPWHLQQNWIFWRTMNCLIHICWLESVEWQKCMCFDQGEQFQFFFHYLFVVHLFIRLCLDFPGSHLCSIGRFRFRSSLSFPCVHFGTGIILIPIAKSGLVDNQR